MIGYIFKILSKYGRYIKKENKESYANMTKRITCMSL